MQRRHFISLAPAALAAPWARAQGSWPSQQIRWVVPYPAGGGTDALARSISEAMRPALNNQVLVVDNRPGASTNIAGELVAAAKPDGYTVMITLSITHINVPILHEKLPFDPVKDFAPVGLVAYSPHILAARPSLPAKDVKELIALAKSKPNSVNFAISGTGGANHLAGIDFAMRTGIDWTYIPYKGGSQAINDVMAGQADLLFNGMVATYPMVKGGKLKALAISSAKRFPGAPELPTVAEAAGLAGFETGSFQGIVAPAGTPAPVVATLHNTLAKILATPDMQKRLQDLGAEYRPGSSAEFGEFIKTEKARWAKVVKDSGAKFD